MSTKSIPKFNWEDPFLLSDQLTDDERQIYKTATEYSQSKLLPRVLEGNRKSEFDPNILREMGELGFLGCTLQGYGCAGANLVSLGLIARAIESVDSGYRTALSLQCSLVMWTIHAFGSEEQKAQLLPELAAGRRIGCFALTEPQLGSDSGSLLTVARSQPDGSLLVSGSKRWISLAPAADLFIIWAKDDKGEARALLIERGAKGLSVTKTEGLLSLRACPTGSIELDNVPAPASAVLPGARGLGSALAGLNLGRFCLTWGALGAAESCFRIARNYALERRQFGAPLAANQLVQRKLADMSTEISLGYQSVLRMSRLMEENRCPSELISMMKRNSCGKALDIARQARDMLGGNGVSDEYHVMRHSCNLEAVSTYEGTHDVHALVLGRAITGIGAFAPGAALAPGPAAGDKKK